VHRSKIPAALICVAVVATAAVALAGCGGVATSSASAATPTPTAVVANLSQLLIHAGPSGFAQQPDSAGDTGPSDLAKAARDDGKPDATSVLKKDGFVAGYQRLWAEPTGGTYVVVFLYSFTNSTGTVNYEQRGLSILTSDPASKMTQQLPVSGIPGAIGFTGTTHSQAIDAVVYTKGDYLVQVAMQGPTATYALAAQVASAQFARLP
jgi:hypothetical protein